MFYCYQPFQTTSGSTVITGVSDDGPLTASGQARGSLRSSEKALEDVPVFLRRMVEGLHWGDPFGKEGIGGKKT